MGTEDHDEPAGDSRPTADDGPFTLTVDGEVFTVRLRPGEPGACDYDWVSGPNKGYGFSSFQRVAFSSIQDRANTPSTLQPNTIDEHRESIRDFLGQINPETGYIGD
ncbi:hypothetical protein WSS_A41290 [Rhodococcus opacus M213]|uniref:Uncharacterized protein n=1 Tax=Rhodococcus opacus M213 TaxID=1129896 RepID=K8X5I9_RHOOP|nr:MULTISPECIES: hypothetical protein [Rhodococcus]EKT76708.1 hypothetical protein WSS_A41290 [Rhodococcus opacus M213]